MNGQEEVMKYKDELMLATFSLLKMEVSNPFKYIKDKIEIELNNGEIIKIKTKRIAKARIEQ